MLTVDGSAVTTGMMAGEKCIAAGLAAKSATDVFSCMRRFLSRRNHCPRFPLSTTSTLSAKDAGLDVPTLAQNTEALTISLSPSFC